MGVIPCEYNIRLGLLQCIQNEYQPYKAGSDKADAFNIYWFPSVTYANLEIWQCFADKMEGRSRESSGQL